MKRCEGEPGCDGVATRRDCGHYACDACTDDATNLCSYCVPVDDIDYLDACQRREELLTRAADRMWSDQLDVDDLAAVSEWETRQRYEQEVRNG